jgi:hypothetical protein
MMQRSSGVYTGFSRHTIQVSINSDFANRKSEVRPLYFTGKVKFESARLLPQSVRLLYVGVIYCFLHFFRNELDGNMLRIGAFSLHDELDLVS